MRKLVFKSLITFFVTSSALLLIPMSSYAQVNMKILTNVAKSCQKDALSSDYYKLMGFDNDATVNDSIKDCISARYHYSLVLSKFSWLSSTGEILPGYLSSVLVGTIAYKSVYYNLYSPTQILDCIASKDISSQECKVTRGYMSQGLKMRYVLWRDKVYLVYVCPTCFVAYDDISGSQEQILTAFMKWFLTLDKPKRRELMSLLGDEKPAVNLKYQLIEESRLAVQEYTEARARVEQQERERRRREILDQ
ncbi:MULTISPECIES: hypothetical protein [unclassified Tolypothrix]|uniref:hypothetical protein n=1 Tax=unclassified Tolypothrix TaxID=2649714 RepID=UPI0005EAA4D7|nr:MULTISPECIES: hypothetical protein [unclassified Tolypothrix]BAY91530.1 hypothetical protein NIES3275_35540 [Microchaete diplosiphon NIES-3275]EKF05396.1 hypothetical protein FDUTEX481_01568 [Tolypothrix sp. PCC 7601]MBE9081666.1 hypothetical protein [Tolypothrix sp. LEGE 11397]UYD25559.1 hypothetical protein HGR01_30135 [Tolypothrix sp. PCC 7712]UYD32198.1 hypothetical protein HG267_24405 [Tolypothrix sp. PCC 7601]